DKVHFFMAHEYRELNQIDDMVKEYRSIIKDYPDSVYVPESYLLLGDYFISKQDLDTAKKHYEAILRYPGSAAVSIARYKLGWCEINQLRFCEAIRLFEEVVKGVEKGKNIEIDTYKRVDIKQEALMDMAYCYTECNKDSSPEEALAYFQKGSWSRQVYTAVLEKLANRYYIKKKWAHAAVIYRRLSDLEQEPVKLLEFARNIFECVQATGSYGRADQDVELIVKALKKEKFSVGVTDEQKQRDQRDFEVYARNIVTYLHDDARKKDSIDDFRRAGDAYRAYLEFFAGSPAYDEMAENYAEALFSSKQYIRAGKQYEALSAKMEYGEQVREEKLYGAVISYYSAIREKERLNYYETAFARDGLRVTGTRYAGDFPSSPRVPDVLFNVAWISYDAGDYAAAIRDFTKYIAAYPDCKATKAAVHLVLDSYNLKEDYEGLIRFGNSITAEASIPDSKLKNEVAAIVKATESKIVSSLAVAAIDDWESGKTGLMDFAAKSASTGMGEQALYTVVVSSKEKGDVKTLLTTGSSLVRDYPRSDKA
ncbi:tetratricopeptide repeat protein, partial [bacterium]|nr:tetratricopeptide repeat protein [bacterium]